MVLILVVLHGPQAARSQPAAWVPLSHGLTEVPFRLVATSPADPQYLYAGSDRLLYRSLNGGRHWETCFRAALSTRLLDLAVDPFDPKHLLLATTDGLHASANGGNHWEQVLGGTGACRIARFHPRQPGRLWAGTAQGLFQSTDGGKNWRAIKIGSSREAITSIAIGPQPAERLLVLTERGLWASAGEAWTRLFPASTAEPLEAEELPEDAPEASTLDHFTEVVADPQHADTVYLAGTQGLLVSQDAGQTWQRATHVGLGSEEIRHLIVHAPSALVAATPKGVARYRPGADRWEPLYAGLSTQAIHRLAASPSKIFAATDQGLFSLDVTEDLLAQGAWPGAREILGNFIHEPTIGQVQAHAIAYAEVHPDKIRRWRRQAALQALLPTFSFGFDRDEDTYVTSSGSTTNPAFDRIIRAEDPSQSLDASLSWDLGDLIWNDDQTAIDVRSKLMVQLRDEVISDVTRTFFERRRVQVELLTNPPADPKTQLEQELRLQELTALLDGWTGGWFSEQLSPELDRGSPEEG